MIPVWPTTRIHPIFVYGTLQLPEVMFAVTGRRFNSQAARLDGFARYRLRGKSFPGVRPEPGAMVDGLVYWGVDKATLERLDAFEDSFYHREWVTVSIAGDSTCSAETYVINEENHGMLVQEKWCLEDFRHQHLSTFLLRRE